MSKTIEELNRLISIYETIKGEYVIGYTYEYNRQSEQERLHIAEYIRDEIGHEIARLTKIVGKL